MYNYQSLKNVDYDDIVECFNLAFSDYYVPMQLTKEQLQMHFLLSGVDINLSYGAFIDNQMIGFIFNSSNIFNGEKVVFDVGTGVVPLHRGNKVFTNLFKYMQKELAKNHIHKYYLEVLQQNDKAISSYKKQGFNVTRHFVVLNASYDDKAKTNNNIVYVEFNQFDFNDITHCINIKPSYEHSINVLKANPNFYDISYIKKDNMITAYCVYSKVNGSIVQFGYSNIIDMADIVEALLKRFKNITIKNIDIIYTDLLTMLNDIGFKEVCKQFEMVKTIFN
ncbi:MAG: GNAT family N-acetyltransferase [Erysipelotrichaceae bacterium]